MSLREKSMARVIAGIINWPGERIPSSNILNRQNRTNLSSKINFLGGYSIRVLEGRNPPR